MAENSKIEWTDHTFNIVWGCQRVSPGCQHCYAETLANRWGYSVWGPAKTTQRRIMSARYWQQPYRWNKEAREAGGRRRVFCGSMCDVFEDHPTNNEVRPDLFGLIEETPHLDWLLLTKRPAHIAQMLPKDWLNRARNNVWLGTSVENQEQADKRIPELLKVPAKVRFLSCEPLLGPVDISRWLVCPNCDGDGEVFKVHWAGRQSFAGGHVPCPACQGSCWRGDLHWLIAGGESGHGARPMHPQWVRSLRDQCVDANVSYFFKQWGEYRYGTKRPQREADGSITFHDDDMPLSIRVGKKAAGRILDDRTWDEVPAL